ncbi:matrixin family metalloprotease [Gottfriedia sp. NPDC057991]|uniref:matrixin family metalloprotease n=1 Tax=Gottfriedia sp. NPDC057991 TaxID=3346298 RepID=UPI0036DF3F3F
MNLGRKKYFFSIAVVFIIVIFFGLGRALAYSTTSPYKLVGGINSKTYYIGDPGGTWASSIRSGVSSWNSLSYANYSEKSTSNQTLNYFVGAFGNTGWCGFTYYVDSDGSMINYGGYPNKNWYKNEVQLNTSMNYQVCSASKKIVAMHEMGHSMGLKHSTNTGALMYDGYKTIDYPTTDDLNGIEALY